jgi:hypothetical protein
VNRIRTLRSLAVGRGVLAMAAVAVFALLLALAGCGSDETKAGAVSAAAGTCSADADCAGLDDGDACNGTLRCDPALGVCRVDPVSVVVCDASADTACAAAVCEAATGACALKPRNEGLACDDGEPCTLGDLCKAGVCAAGATSICPCSEDSDCKDDDDSVCTGVPFCNTAVFPTRCETKASSVVQCPASDEACKANLCDPKDGSCVLVPLQDGAACDDDDACTSGDACKGGSCYGGADTCACESDSDCVDVDGDPCTGVPFCDKSGGKGVCAPNPATVIVCSSAADTDCRKNTCDPQLGACALKPVADKSVCDDGDACTKGEICVAGACTAGTDVCKCVSDADCSDKKDGNLCNGTLFCNQQSGLCELNPASVVTCPTVEDTACSKNVCTAKTGKCKQMARADVVQVGCQAIDLGGGVVAQFCLYAPKEPGSEGDGAVFACEDGESCTKGDVCEGKSCKAGAAVCECSADADCKDKDDGNLCNGTLFCNAQSGKCELNPATVVSCPNVDDTDCLKNVCNPKLGVCQATPSPSGTPCDDGDACTKGDVCKIGQCAPGTFACACKTDLDCLG